MRSVVIIRTVAFVQEQSKCYLRGFNESTMTKRESEYFFTLRLGKRSENTKMVQAGAIWIITCYSVWNVVRSEFSSPRTSDPVSDSNRVKSKFYWLNAGVQ